MVLASLDLLGYPRAGLVMTDVTLYSSWGEMLSEGQFPTDDPTWQYPPLAALLFVAAAAMPDAQLGFTALAFAADAAAMAGLLLAARGSQRYLGAWLWAFAALIVGPLFLARFDVFPTAAVIGGLLLVARRPAWAGAVLGIGTALKIWPALALAAVRRAKLPAALGGFAAAMIGATAAMWIWFGSAAWSFLAGQSERGLQVESVAGLPYVIAHALGARMAIVYRYGSMEVDAVGAGLAATLATVIGVVLLGWLALRRLQGRLDSVPGPDVAFAAVAVSVVTSRVFSPQYSIWLLGVLAVCLGVRGTRMGLPAALVVAAAVLAQVIFPPLYPLLIGGDPGVAWLQVTRIVLVVTATVVALVRVLRTSTGRRASTAPSAPAQASASGS
ncbi:MAG: glycosyltransferase 87 family protein [Candidatus Nanopelagicales bacterium]